MQTVADEVLIANIAQSDQRAMAALFARHRVAVYRFVLRMARNEATAEEVERRCFSRCMAAGSNLRGSFDGLDMDFQHRPLQGAHGAATPARRGTGRGGSQRLLMRPTIRKVALTRKDKTTALRHCLQKLSAEHREIVNLIYDQHKSIQEFAGILGMPEATAKTRMF